MKIYFDESGQTGCVLQKDDLLNFRIQPTFALGALIIPTETDEKKMLEKYTAFKRKYGIEGEIKGNELLTRNRNKELEYIIKHIFDDSHFHIIFYDKRFYISTKRRKVSVESRQINTIKNKINKKCFCEEEFQNYII